MSQVILGDCRVVLPTLPGDSIDLCVTSPPYWGLRAYSGLPDVTWGGDSECKHEWGEASFNQTRGSVSDKSTLGGGKETQNHQGTGFEAGAFCAKCGAWRGQLGHEPHPKDYVAHVVEVMRLVRRVLKPSGSLWLNLGDSYHSGGRPGGVSGRGNNKRPDDQEVNPEDSANRLIGEDGGWLQQKQLMLIPSRVAAAMQDDGWILRSDVIWYKNNHMPEPVEDRLTKSYEHVFFFVKSPRYYFKLDEIRVPHSRDWRFEGGSLSPSKTRPHSTGRQTLCGNNSDNRPAPPQMNPLGKNPGDVWTIPTQPFAGSHFAVFPEALVERIVKCACPPGGTVLDPFAGSGTTGRVARRLGRHHVLIEANPEYHALIRQRLRADDYEKAPDGVTPLG